MLCKAIVESVLDNGYSVKIRVPHLDKLYSTMASTLNNRLLVASVLTSPGIFPAYKQGDIVFVDFEEEDYFKPVVVGRLHRKSGVTSSSDVVAESIQALVNLDVPTDVNKNDAKLQYLEDSVNNLYSRENP